MYNYGKILGGNHMVVYFGKLNLNSSHIYKVYKKEIGLRDILSKLLICLKDGNIYEKEEVFKDGAEIKISTTTYKLTINEKTDDYIYGYLYKDAKIYYKQFNELTKELEWHHVISNETADFYLDVYSETVGYLTSTRFGYREFLYAFEGIINNSMEAENYDYRFTVDLLTSGLEMDDIKEELNKIGNIQKLKIKIQPPNINDEFINEIENNAEETINNFEEANIGTKSIILTSSSILGLKINSKEINEQLDQASKIHSKISSKALTKNGYIEIEATDKYGNRTTTGDNKAVKKIIDNVVEFKHACETVITNRKLKGSDFDIE